MKLSAKPKYFFHPDFNGNLALPEAERVAVEILRPTAEDRGDLTNTETTKNFLTQEVTIRTKFNARAILRRHVGEIKNLTVEEPGEKGKAVEKKILSGALLAESTAYGTSKLVDLICLEVMSDILTEAEKKST